MHLQFVFLRQSAGKERNRRASCLFDNKREVRQVIKIWWGFPERVVSSFYEGVSRMTTLLARTCRQLLLPGVYPPLAELVKSRKEILS